MDVFAVHQELIDDYRAFTSGFVDVRDARVREHVAQQLEQGLQWPDPWLSLNPSFEPGGTVAELVGEGLLEPECERIFRAKADRDDPGSRSLALHRHQHEDATAGCSYGDDRIDGLCRCVMLRTAGRAAWRRRSAHPCPV